MGHSLEVRWLGLCAFIVEGLSSIPKLAANGLTVRLSQLNSLGPSYLLYRLRECIEYS